MIHVSAIELSSREFYEVSVPERAIIAELKDTLASSCHLQREGMRIVWNARLIKDSEVLADIGITDSSCISIYVRGMKEEPERVEDPPAEAALVTEDTAGNGKYNIARMEQVLRSVYDVSRTILSDHGPNKMASAKLSLDHRYGDLFSDYQKYAVLLLCGGNLDERATKILEYNRVTDSLVDDCFAACDRIDSQNIFSSGLVIRSLISKHGLTDIWPSERAQFAKDFGQRLSRM